MQSSKCTAKIVHQNTTAEKKKTKKQFKKKYKWLNLSYRTTLMTVSGVIQTPFKRPFFEIGEMGVCLSS